MIGHPNAEYTQVPARDAVASGAIERSNKFPNDSYFRRWTNVDDAITWKAEVGASGTYAVRIYYACKPDAIGTTLELSFNGSKLAGKIPAANDVPETGGENDRLSARNLM